MSRSRTLYAISRELMRRKTSDVFERDPFKIQSYNFRYAERPAYPVQQYPRSNNDSSLPYDIPRYTPRYSTAPPRYATATVTAAAGKTFETYYLNPNFAIEREQQREGEPQNASLFHEHRRRKFLQDFHCISTAQNKRPQAVVEDVFKRQNSATVTPQPRRGAGGGMGVRGGFLGSSNSPLTVTNSPLLRSNCTRGQYLGGLAGRGSSSCCLAQRTSNSRSGGGGGGGAAGRQGNNRSSGTSLRSTTRKGEKTVSGTTFQRGQRRSVSNTNVLHAKLEPKRSSCSGCEININISSMDSDEDGENVRIKIETDACLLNNTDKAKTTTTTTTASEPKSRSAESLFIDKRLSKFAISRDGPKLTNYFHRGNSYDPLLANRQQQQQRERLRADLAQERARFGDRERELEEDRQRARQRDKERERLRKQERERDRQRLLDLEHERENDRLRELERQTQREREAQRIQAYLEQQQRERTMPLPAPTPPPTPMIMQSHLYRPSSQDRLPGMMPFRNRPPAAACMLLAPQPSRTSQKSEPGNGLRAQRLQSSLQNLRSLRGLKTLAQGPRLERRSSNTSNCNATATPAAATITAAKPVAGAAVAAASAAASSRAASSRANSQTSLRRVSATRLAYPPLVNATHERKLLNSSPHSPIHTRINNMPIRITTSQPTNADAEFSLSQVRVRHMSSSPSPMRAPQRRCSQVQIGTPAAQAGQAAQKPYNVNINVYADNLRMMRI